MEKVRKTIGFDGNDSDDDDDGNDGSDYSKYDNTAMNELWSLIYWLACNS